MEKLWFRAKRYGWGWYPITWQGWVCILGFLLLLYGNWYRLKDAVMADQKFVVEFVIESFLLSVILILICFIKGESPAWHWGDN